MLLGFFVMLQILSAKHNAESKGQALHSSSKGTNSPAYAIEMIEYG